MSLPFSPGQFFAVFARYNDAVWPFQAGMVMLGTTAFLLIVVRHGYSDRVISAILALLWAWMGIVYHLFYFREINPAAILFGIAFLAGSGVFAWTGVVRNQLRFDCPEMAQRTVGYALIAYAMLVYPVASAILGHAYPATPTFGLPCPTTIFTIGVLAFLRAPYPRYVLAVPLAWAIVGSQAAWLLGVVQDLSLMVAGVAGIWLASRRAPRVRHA